MKIKMIWLTAAIVASVPFAASAQTITLASTVPDTGVNAIVVEKFVSQIEGSLPDAKVEIF